MSSTIYLGNCISIKKTDSFDVAAFCEKYNLYQIPNNDNSFDADYWHLIENQTKIGIEIDYGFTPISETSVSQMRNDFTVSFTSAKNELFFNDIEYLTSFGLFMYAY